MVDGHQNDGGRKYSTYLDIFVAKLRLFASVNYKGHNKTVLKIPLLICMMTFHSLNSLKAGRGVAQYFRGKEVLLRGAWKQM